MVPIDNFEGYYISKYGQVWSTKSNKYLKPKISNSGYLYVRLLSTEARFIHRLVAHAFIANPENKEQVNHKDGKKHNNSVDNLEWVTRSENTKHAYKMKLRTSTRTSNKEILQYDFEGNLIAVHNSIKEAQVAMNKPNNTSIRHHLREPLLYKSAYGYVWKYKEG